MADVASSDTFLSSQTICPVGYPPLNQLERMQGSWAAGRCLVYLPSLEAQRVSAQCLTAIHIGGVRKRPVKVNR